MNKPSKVITHTAASSTTATQFDCDVWHKERWPGFTSKVFVNPKTGIGWHVGYHIWINWDGSWVQTRAFYEEGAHCLGQNTSSIGVCFAGNGDIHEPSDAQVKAWREEVWPQIHNAFPAIKTNNIYPHRKYANKTCHGSLLSDTYYADVLHTDSDNRAKLQAQLIQLLNRLYVILSGERMK